ncbi:hypothetical protein LINPERHAP1_LOCUS30878 [Linum perenne]
MEGQTKKKKKFRFLVAGEGIKGLRLGISVVVMVLVVLIPNGDGNYDGENRGSRRVKGCGCGEDELLSTNLRMVSHLWESLAIPLGYPKCLNRSTGADPEADLLIEEADSRDSLAITILPFRCWECTRLWKVEAFASRATIVHIDIDSTEIRKNKQPHVAMCADLKLALEGMNMLLESNLELNFSDWRNEIQE